MKPRPYPDGLIVAVLWIAVVVVYAPVLDHEFVDLDDDQYVTDNPIVRDGWSPEAVRRAFTTTHASNWHPLTWLSHMLDVELFGFDAGRHHGVNVALHALNASILFLALFTATSRRGPSAFVAAVFALHPLRVESVAWVAERKDLLAGLFGLLAVAAYGRYLRRRGPVRHGLVAVMLALGLLSKPMLVSLPVVLLLLDVWPFERRGQGGRPGEPWARLVLEKLPFFGLALASSFITLWAQRQGGAVGSFEALPLVTRVANAGESAVLYLWKTMWPVGLAPFYPHPAAASGHLGPARLVLGLAAVVLLLGVTWVLVGRRSRQRYDGAYLAVGWLWYLVMLVPVAGLIQVGQQARADRYTYLPTIGIYLMVAWWLADVAGRRRVDPRALTVAAAALVVTLGIVARVQVEHWRSSEALYEHTLQVTRNNFFILNNLGVRKLDAGDLAGAEADFLAALEIKPDYADALYNSGLCELRQGHRQQAAERFAALLERRPRYAEAHNALGVMLMEAGSFEAAQLHYRNALASRPDYPQAHNNLGTLLGATGRPEEAERHFREAIRGDPAYFGAHLRLARLLAEQGRYGEARGVLERALALEPGHPAVLDLLGRLRDAR